MSQISTVVGIVADLMRGEGGLQANIDAIAATEDLPGLTLSELQVIAQNVSAEIAERSTFGKYPCVHIYCEKATNQLREKFRTFSGEIALAVEVRASTDRIERLDDQINVLVDAVTATLDQNRGDWGTGIFYGGAYEIVFAGVKHGGRNFTQMAKVTFTLEMSRN